MKNKVALICLLSGAFLLGFAFYFGMIYFPFRVFTEIRDSILTLISVSIALVFAILNYKSVLSFVSNLLIFLARFRFSQSS